MSKKVTLVKGKNNMIGISIGGGAPICPVLYVVQVSPCFWAQSSVTQDLLDICLICVHFHFQAHLPLCLLKIFQFLFFPTSFYLSHPLIIIARLCIYVPIVHTTPSVIMHPKCSRTPLLSIPTNHHSLWMYCIPLSTLSVYTYVCVSSLSNTLCTHTK